MALIQIRDVPEDVYETIRTRARQAGQSIQAYMLAQITEMGRRPTPSEIIEAWQAKQAKRPPVEIDVETLLADIRRDRP